jgi:tetratricopeptide (TPR) repeat protein
MPAGRAEPEARALKWLIVVLALAAVLIVAGVTLTGTRQSERISADPKAQLLCEEGTEDLHAFRLNDAVDKLGKALELDPGLAEASISRAFAFVRLGERDNYKQELARADSLTGLIADEKRRLLAQLRLGDFASSKHFAFRDSVMTRLKAEAPDNIYVLIAEAATAAREGDDEATAQAWKRVLDKDPNYANSYNMLGYMELHRGNYDKAIEYMQKYAFLAPDQANPHDSLGDVLMVLGRYEEAEAEFRAAVTMQPDFYYSLINLGRTYLARGQLSTGLDILEKVRRQVTGSDIEMRVDREIVSAYLVAGLEDQLAAASAAYVVRYPEDGIAGLYRAVGLAYQERYEDSRAVMDSCLTEWRRDKSEGPKQEAQKRTIDSVTEQYDGLVADLRGDHAAAAAHWAAAADAREGETPEFELWYFRYREAAALQAAGKPSAALSLLDPMLAVNPRIINALALKVRCHLDLHEGEQARGTLEQLQRSLGQADADYPARAEAAELEAVVSAMTTN